ncbi:MAG: hypothetical protein ACKVU1_10185 [bacterium]
MGFFYFLLVVAGCALTIYGFGAAGKAKGASSLIGAILMIAGTAMTFGGLVLWLVPGFLG